MSIGKLLLITRPRPRPLSGHGVRVLRAPGRHGQAHGGPAIGRAGRGRAGPGGAPPAAGQVQRGGHLRRAGAGHGPQAGRPPARPAGPPHAGHRVGAAAAEISRRRAVLSSTGTCHHLSLAIGG